VRARGPGRLLVGFAWAAALLTVTASSADAKPGYFVLSPSAYLGFTVQGSNGYKIEVTRIGKEVEVWVGRRGGGLAKYQAPAQTRRGTIKANLGKLGRLDLQFDAKSIEIDRSGPKGCRGEPSVYELGAFSGTMRFQGEGGYTRFSAKRIQGWISHNPREVCKKPDWLLPDPGKSHKPAKETDEGTGREIKAVGAAMSSSHRSVYVRFTSIVVPPRPGQRRLSLAVAKAEVHERRGRVAIERSNLILAGENALLLGPPSRSPTATLTLPPPFAGSGTYSISPEGTPIWSGSLRVHLPGAALALAGAGFVAAFCQGSTLEAISNCMRPVKAEAERGPH
jgi:hypothetical protein